MIKKRLTQDQEFQLLKIVLDKFLWIGIGIMLFGFYGLVNQQVASGVSLIVAGAIVLVLLIVLLVKHYEISP